MFYCQLGLRRPTVSVGRDEKHFVVHSLDESVTFGQYDDAYRFIGDRQRVSLSLAMAGLIDDQAALPGLLVRIHNLGLPLISVLREKEGET